ncbi:PP2C family protein-serine/threonine phosphatase [Streptomyces sp. SID3343]|uniref:PP2C family protein-serine/threonine phosphatase n=1 Tax=Streptomyces sp. SID3343 TaxID=2690260 RepID=UPI00137124E4|nr:PP2C family protein-serine/threonine phosphatase [Streptomyces sp. SID3343]MYW05517.1 SpoIIE family protein phosphatase [Streptomyces sp. SID3343]
MLAGLLAAAHLMPIEMLPAKTAEHARAAGFTEVLIYLVDLQGRTLSLLPGPSVAADGEDEPRVGVEGTVPGRAYQHGRVLPGGGEGQWWQPLLDGTERLGVLRVTTVHDDARAREDMDRLAALLALIITGHQKSSDTLAKLVRAHPLNLAAEMQWNMMPARSYADGRVVICASMEPAYDISGDIFEYAIDGPLIHLTIFDAMGHDTAAGLCGTLALGACRNSRRQGADLIAKGEAIEAALIDQYQRTRYVTGILATLDTRTGILSWVNRGHHSPVVIRGNRWTSHLACPPAHPMGTDLGIPSIVCREQLEPGDRIVLYTDGITEARRADDTEFGLERFTRFLIRHHADGLPVPETLRRLTRAVLDYHDGRLQDDATVLICEWLGPTAENTRPAAVLSGLPDPDGYGSAPGTPNERDGGSRP